MGERYSPSNKFSLVMALACFVVVTFLSFILTGTAALIGMWLFPPYAGMVLVVLSSIGIYWLQKFSIKISDNRNLVVSRVIIFISSLLIAYYHLACVFSFGSLKESSGGVMSFKSIIDIFVGSIAMFGWPGALISKFLSSGVTGILYLIITLLSNIIIPQFAANQATKPFSEENLAWMQEVQSVGKFEPFPDREHHKVVTAMKNHDISVFTQKPIHSVSTPLDYGVLLFYKSGNRHSGFVGVQHYHTIDGKNPQHQMIEFIPPIMVGKEYAAKLEAEVNALNATGKPSSSFSNEEIGYNLYRTADEAAKYKYNDNKIADSYESTENLTEDEKIYSPALNKQFRNY